MSFTIYHASAPVFVHSLTNMETWLDKAQAEGRDEATLVEARLAPDMRPFAAQIQMASDCAKNAIGRLAGADAPSMPDTETTFAELKDRCRRTVVYIESVAPDVLAASAEREIQVKFPNGMGYRFNGRDYLTSYALPNFFFHVTTAYAILRNQGVALGKPDFLRHVGPPNLVAAG
jgi:hypothetical protein